MIALEFIYLGWTDADIAPVALELLALAFKLELTYLEMRCISHLMAALDLSNVVDVVILAHVHEMEEYGHERDDSYIYPDLYKFCVPFIKANAHRFSDEDWNKLQQKPALLKQLLADCCFKHWEK